MKKEQTKAIKVPADFHKKIKWAALKAEKTMTALLIEAWNHFQGKSK